MPGSQSLNFAYDEFGNLQSGEDLTTHHKCEFVYDSEGLLRSTTAAAQKVDFDYDGAGNRVLTRYPAGREIRCALLWTEGPRLMPISPEILAGYVP